MKPLSDFELLADYAAERSEEAFRELAERHVTFIYSAAMRQLRNAQLAQEATQSAFLALARNASRIRPPTVVAGWLHRAVHYAALNLQRSEARRELREAEAALMNTPNASDPDLAEPRGAELLLEPLGFAPARDYQRALHEAGIPLTSFAVGDLAGECDRLQRLGVAFSMPPTKRGPTLMAVLEDTCGNHIQLVQPGP